MTWRETDDLSEILAALDNGQRVEVSLPGEPWMTIQPPDRSWLAAPSRWGFRWRFRIEVPDAPSLPPGVVATYKAQAKDCPALVDAGWTVRYLTTGGPMAESVVRTRADAWPGDWFEVCPPEGER